ncbi:MAG: ABC transporter substrate-binding protein [Deltaproteobacteria bacterium]|nr:ABC transporter substrate-binding protein [Deltaproteobacteria bacterium]
MSWLGAFLRVSAFLTILATSGAVLGKPTVRVGLLADLSGSTGEIGREAERVAGMAVDRVNARGGVAGRLVELAVFDTEGEPILARDGTRELVSIGKVAAVLGPTDWASAMMTKPLFEETRVPAMMLTWDDAVIQGGKYGRYEWIFRLPPGSRTALGKVGGFLRERGWTKVALVVASGCLGREAREWFERWSGAYGLETVATCVLTPDSDVRSALADLAMAEPQVVVSWCSLPIAATVAVVLRGLGVELPLFQCHEISPRRYVEMAGPAARGSLLVSNKMLVWEDLDDWDCQKRMIADFFHQYVEVYRYGDGHWVNPLAGYVWDSVMILVEAIKEAECSGRALRDAIEGVYRHVGLGGVYGFTHEDHNGLDPDSVVVAVADGIRRDGRRWVGSWRLARKARWSAGILGGYPW